MSASSMDVFSLRDTVVGEYRKFATSFTTIHAEDIRAQVEAIYAEGRFWPEPLIQINPSYKKGANLLDLIGGGALEPGTGDIFRADGAPLSLYKHQEQAIALAAQGESYVVTTGTGSGKSLCFFIPIVNAVLAEKRMRTVSRTRAIIIYPMNALANSQLEELDKFIKNVPGERPVTFARYTGQEDTEERRRISENPPDILLTNFMMLELLMTRQDELDRRVIGNCAGLRFLVLDELHTYRGRQGADVALLVRRVRERLSPEKLQCIGTSATMASEGSLEDKGRVVARVASKLFSIEIPESNVIVETLERVTDSAQSASSVQTALGPAIDAGLASNISDAALRTHPLTIWVETRLGVSWSEIDQRWVRARPLTVEEAARALSWKHSWVLAWRDIAMSTDERSFIASVVPSLAVPDTAKVVFVNKPQVVLIPTLIANAAAFAFDFVARQKIGGTHMSAFIVEQLPLLPVTASDEPSPWAPSSRLRDWLFPRVLELTYTAWDLEPFAHDVGYGGPPFRWEPERRFLLRCELDAAFFHLYGLSRDDTGYVMDTFPIVRKNDEKAHGEYRTKRVILEIYDAMAAAARTGKPYQTRLDPPPADPRVAHPDTRPAAAKKGAQ